MWHTASFLGALPSDIVGNLAFGETRNVRRGARMLSRESNTLHISCVL
jgi:hypothetical protein